MKKLLYTTAIAGVVFGSVANAETKVTGNLALSYASTDDQRSTTPQNWSGFGKESQINISNSGDLSNGMKYAAGFSLEMDGGDLGSKTGTSTNNGWLGQQNENVYIDLISGNTTISIGADHFQNTDAQPTNLVGFGNLAPDSVSQGTAGIYISSQATNYGNWGIGLMQKTDVGTIGVNFTPSNDGNNQCNDIFNVGTGGVACSGQGKAATEVNFKGDLGVKGLTVLAGKLMQDNTDGTSKDGQRIAATYTTGKMTVAVDTAKIDTAATTSTTSKSIGVAYAVNDQLSIGALRASSDKTGGTADEDINLFAIGYNLGAVAIQAQLKDVEGVGGNNGYNGKQYGVMISTKF